MLLHKLCQSRSISGFDMPLIENSLILMKLLLIPFYIGDEESMKLDREGVPCLAENLTSASRADPLGCGGYRNPYLE
jgi:hypothetical protein